MLICIDHNHVPHKATVANYVGRIFFSDNGIYEIQWTRNLHRFRNIHSNFISYSELLQYEVKQGSSDIQQIEHCECPLGLVYLRLIFSFQAIFCVGVGHLTPALETKSNRMRLVYILEWTHTEEIGKGHICFFLL